jgi:hypothetical protein
VSAQEAAQRFSSGRGVDFLGGAEEEVEHEWVALEPRQTMEEDGDGGAVVAVG